MKTLLKNSATGLMIGAILVIGVAGIFLQNADGELIGGAVLLLSAALVRVLCS